MLHVPYKGSAAALTDVVGGQVFISFSSIEPAFALVKANKRATSVRLWLPSALPGCRRKHGPSHGSAFSTRRR